MALEREVKLNVGDDFQLPPLMNLDVGLSTTPLERRTLETVYFDTVDLRLARWGYSLRHREGEAWTLKRPASVSGAVLAREELVFAGVGDTPPAEAQRLVRAYVRRAPLAPVARLSTVRQRVRIRTSDGVTAAEVVDDAVTVVDSGLRFRQVEVELGPAADEHLLTQLLKRLHAAGAGPPDLTPEHVRALGPRAETPAEVAPGELPAKPLLGDVLRHTVAVSVTALFRHDAGARLGDDPEDVHQARVAVRRLRSDLRNVLVVT